MTAGNTIPESQKQEFIMVMKDIRHWADAAIMATESGLLKDYGDGEPPANEWKEPFQLGPFEIRIKIARPYLP